MDKSTHEEHLFQALQTNNKQFKIAVTFLSGHNGIFNVTNSNNKLYFKKSITDEAFIQFRISNGAYEVESLNTEIKRNIIDKEYYSEDDYPFIIKLNISTLGSIVQLLKPTGVIGFVFDDKIGNLLGFDETLLYKAYNLSHNPVDILSFSLKLSLKLT